MKKLQMRYKGSTGKKHTLSMSDINEQLDDQTVREQMTAIATVGLFEKDKELLYAQPLAANYSETIITPIFNDEELVDEAGTAEADTSQAEADATTDLEDPATTPEDTVPQN